MDEECIIKKANPDIDPMTINIIIITERGKKHLLLFIFKYNDLLL